MPFKLIFDNEMHRCSTIPDHFQYFSSFIFNTFRSRLPSPFWLYYVTPQGQQLPISNEEDYQILKRIQSDKAVKIYVTDKQPDLQLQGNNVVQNLLDYDVIPQALDSDITEEVIIREERKEEDIPLLKPHSEEGDHGAFDKIIDDVARTHLESEIVSKTEQDHLKEVVKASIEEQMPVIIAKVKATLIKEGLIKEEQLPKPPQNPWKKDGYHPSTHIPIQQPYAGANYPVQQGPAPGIYQGQYQAPHQAPYQGPPQPQNAAPNNQGNDIFAWIGKAIENLPAKAYETMDNLAQNIEGDPYVYCVEGRYKKSTVDKVMKLREVFPDEDKKKLLDFTERYPKSVSVEQIAAVYASVKDSENK